MPSKVGGRPFHKARTPSDSAMFLMFLSMEKTPWWYFCLKWSLHAELNISTCILDRNSHSGFVSTEQQVPARPAEIE